jgi:hypothetical protein
MNRRILFIILGALAFALLLIVLWMWFFTGETPGPNTGSFGSGTERPGNATTTGPVTNVPNDIPPGGNNVGAETGGGLTGSGTAGSQTVTGVQWLGGQGTFVGGGNITNFVPSTVNELNNGNISGNVSILGNGGANTATQNGIGLEGALIGAGIGTALCTAGLLGGGTAGGVLSSAALAPVAVTVNAPVQNVKDSNDILRDNFLNCIARTIARAAIQQITSSVVNWINSGFNGKPSFVQNYKQFFTNVLDQAAGEYIKGSALSFLCSPFQNQIRIALAQSYARSNAGAQSCSLTSIANNFTRFTGGNFRAGGWNSLLSLTGTPTNNPFGAYSYGQLGLANAQATAGANANRQVTPTGFLAQQEKYDCVAAVGANGPVQNCKTRITTPGGVIESSLNKTLGTSIDSLNLAKNFDEIISALVRQLMTKALYGGLSNLSGQQGYETSYLTPNQQLAQEQGQALLENLQGMVQYAQQYGTAFQGAIRDIQNTQEQLNTLANCWAVTASSTQNTAKQSQATSNSASALATLASYDSQIATFNVHITRANSAIAFLQELQTRTLGITSTNGVKAITAEYNAALASSGIFLQADVTQAQQDRTTLQTQLTGRNDQTKAGLQQCYAFGV